MENEKNEHPLPLDRELRTCLWDEVIAADGSIDSFPGDREEQVLDGWGVDHDSAQAFKRGRQILQAISYGKKYWTDTYSLIHLTDDEAFIGEPEGVQLGTERILQLILLSRVPVHAVNETWALPDPRTVAREIDIVRAELGVAEEFRRRVADGEQNPPAFPGIDDEHILKAILDGHLRVGNPEQPEVACWQERPPFPGGRTTSMEEPDPHGHIDDLLRRVSGSSVLRLGSLAEPLVGDETMPAIIDRIIDETLGRPETPEDETEEE